MQTDPQTNPSTAACLSFPKAAEETKAQRSQGTCTGPRNQQKADLGGQRVGCPRRTEGGGLVTEGQDVTQGSFPSYGGREGLRPADRSCGGCCGGGAAAAGAGGGTTGPSRLPRPHSLPDASSRDGLAGHGGPLTHAGAGTRAGAPVSPALSSHSPRCRLSCPAQCSRAWGGSKPQIPAPPPVGCWSRCSASAAAAVKWGR